MGYRSVNEMLDSLSSTELTEWKAYEQAAGPLDDSYLSERLASIEELLQQIAILTAQDKKARVRHVPRPYELHEERAKQRAMDTEDVVRNIDRMLEEGEF